MSTADMVMGIGAIFTGIAMFITLGVFPLAWFVIQERNKYLAKLNQKQKDNENNPQDIISHSPIGPLKDEEPEQRFLREIVRKNNGQVERFKG